MANYTHPGLSDKEVIHSRALHGNNRLKKEASYGFWQQFLANFGDPIIKILLVVLVINLVFLFRNQNWYETIGIAVAVLLATLVSTLSEYGSESAFSKMQEEASRLSVTVRRNGINVTLPLEEIVVGDIVLLSTGDPIPADGRLVTGTLSIDQSALNGESHEVEKTSSPHQERDPLINRNTLLRGSVVCFGSGELQVTAVGDNTYYGTVAQGVQDKTRESPLKFRLNNLSRKLSKFGFLAGACVAFADLFHSLVMGAHYHWPSVLSLLTTPSQLFPQLFHALLLALSVIVVAVPEGLPMMITVVLSSNMRRMLKDHVLVRKLVGIETSGSLNLLFTDKTGTLTKGTPNVALFVDGFGNSYVEKEKIKKSVLWELITLSGYYNTEAISNGKNISKGNATERALLSYVSDKSSMNKSSCKIVQQIPFSSSQKWSAVEIGGSFFTPIGFDNNRITLVKGAPDKLLPCCSSFLDTNGYSHPLTSNSRVYKMKNIYEEQSKRVIALAISSSPLNDFPEELTLLGLMVLADEIRSDVPDAIQLMKQAGVQVVMITGDSAETARAIAHKIGLLETEDPHAILTSGDISNMSDQEIAERLPRLRILARALPQDKSRLVAIAQQEGSVVGMTGDGVNDAPALKKADVGFAMGSGTEVAKQAGDIVILNNSFSSIGKAVQYGRTIFKSIRKFIVFQLTMNLCAVAISVIGPFLGIDMPVTVMQMLWINIIMDTLAGLAFAGEVPLTEYMNEMPKKRDEPILNRYMISQILFTGGFTVLLLTLFLYADIFKDWFRYSQSSIYWMTAFFALFIFCGIFNSFNARTTRLNLFAYLSKNKGFLIIISLITIIQLALIYFGGALFRTDCLTVNELLRVIALSALVIPFDIIRKLLLRIFHRKGIL